MSKFQDFTIKETKVRHALIIHVLKAKLHQDQMHIFQIWVLKLSKDAEP